jgi:hypothetical protein
MLTTSDKALEISSETLAIGLGIFVFLVVIDRMSDSTYVRDSFWALFAISVLVIAPTAVGLYHLARWTTKLRSQERSR